MIDVVVDLSHQNDDVKSVAAKVDGIVGVIHKATQGVGYTDPLHTLTWGKAQAAGPPAPRDGGAAQEDLSAGGGSRGGTPARRSARPPLSGSSRAASSARGGLRPLAGADGPSPGSLHASDLEDPAKDKCVS